MLMSLCGHLWCALHASLQLPPASHKRLTNSMWSHETDPQRSTATVCCIRGPHDWKGYVVRNKAFACTDRPPVNSGTASLIKQETQRCAAEVVCQACCYSSAAKSANLLPPWSAEARLWSEDSCEGTRVTLTKSAVSRRPTQQHRTACTADHDCRKDCRKMQRPLRPLRLGCVLVFCLGAQLASSSNEERDSMGWEYAGLLASTNASRTARASEQMFLHHFLALGASFATMPCLASIACRLS